jgi:LacI family transcriptional regulator
MNLEEIAKRTGFSRSTVSRVVNNHPNVRESTRRKVLEVIRELNYQPNAAARSLATRRTQVIGIAIPRAVTNVFTDPFFPVLIVGITGVCNDHDYAVMLWLGGQEEEERFYRRALGSGLMDGVIVSSAVLDDPLIPRLQEAAMPFVVVGRHPGIEDLCYVDVDNRNGARMAVSHLLRQGYRRVGTISGPLNTVPGQDRLAGYRDALQARGVVPDPELIVEGDFSKDSGYEAMHALLRHDVDAVFAASDSMAIGAMRAIREAGKHVPEDIAIVGFDDLPPATAVTPPLTTVHQPVEKLGAMAAEIMIERLQEMDSEPKRVVLPTELIIRASCGSGL